MRRWLAVAAVWAIAATAIAVLAFLSANDDNSQRLSESTSQARRVERRLNAQVDKLEARLAKAPQSTDVQALSKRMTHDEKISARQDRHLGLIEKNLGQFDKQLAAVEKTAADAQRQAQQNTTTTP